MLYLALREEGYINNLAQFRNLTLAQIRAFIKASKKIEETERLNKKLKEDLKKQKGPQIRMV